MKKWMGALFITGAAALVSFSTVETHAQKKTTTAAKAGVIEIIESKDGKFRFSIRDGEGHYLGGTTVGHATEKGCLGLRDK